MKLYEVYNYNYAYKHKAWINLDEITTAEPDYSIYDGNDKVASNAVCINFTDKKAVIVTFEAWQKISSILGLEVIEV